MTAWLPLCHSVLLEVRTAAMSAQDHSLVLRYSALHRAPELWEGWDVDMAQNAPLDAGRGHNGFSTSLGTCLECGMCACRSMLVDRTSRMTNAPSTSPSRFDPPLFPPSPSGPLCCPGAHAALPWQSQHLLVGTQIVELADNTPTMHAHLPKLVG